MSVECQIDISSARRRLAELNRVPWDVLASIELAQLLGVSLQVLSNWRVRKKGPESLPAGTFRRNRTFYWMFEIERWLRSLEGKELQTWEIVAQWLRNRYHFLKPLETEDRTWRVAEQLRGYGVWPLKHKPRRRVPLVPGCR